MSGHPASPQAPLAISTQHLAYLVAVTESSSWSAAASALGVSPSALSQGLAELERRLGITLFDRQGRRQVLRPQAAEVVAYANRVLAQTSDLGRWLTELRTGRTGRLRVGMIDAAAIHHYAGVLRVFRARHPDVDLHLAVAASNELLDQLTRGALDVVVCVAPTEIAAGLDVEPMLTEPLALYAPKGAAAGPPEQWGPWVAFPASSNSRAIITAALRAAGAKIDVVAESHQPEVLKEMVRLGLGWTVLPVVQAESRPGALRRARPEPVAERTLVLARRAAGAPNPAADALIAALRQR